MGHIRALDEGLDAIGLDRDFEPRYEFIKEKSKAIQQIRECSKGLDRARIFLASDDDREGEAISYSVAVLLSLNVDTTPRIVFHEITKEAITSALRAPKRINMDRVSAQQARAVLDMMVGFTISPLLWKFVGQSLSAGRCQTPALRLVTDRESDIKDFSKETTWYIKATWTAPNGSNFEASLTVGIEDEESATNYLENVNDSSEGRVSSAVTKPTNEAPPKPLITSTLQQEASALYSSQPKNTMKMAQKLYEAGYITYMRTDHAVLSEEIKAEALAYIKETYGEEYAPTAPVNPKDKKKKVTGGAQEAHEAIRPTHIATTELPEEEDWSAPERKLYKLIWNRV
jgi:DNA topoisomerase-1